jgi:hypothetical protein
LSDASAKSLAGDLLQLAQLPAVAAICAAHAERMQVCLLMAVHCLKTLYAGSHNHALISCLESIQEVAESGRYPPLSCRAAGCCSNLHGPCGAFPGAYIDGCALPNLCMPAPTIMHWFCTSTTSRRSQSLAGFLLRIAQPVAVAAICAGPCACVDHHAYPHCSCGFIKF